MGALDLLAGGGSPSFQGGGAAGGNQRNEWGDFSSGNMGMAQGGFVQSVLIGGVVVAIAGGVVWALGKK